MDTLSSCYFCSTALDASLDEYPVVPEGLRNESAGQTVVLCDTCARKLDAVFESVVEAVERDAASDRGVAGSGRGEESGGTDETDASLESTLGDDEDVLRSIGDSGAEEGASDADDDSSDDETTAADDTDDDGASAEREENANDDEDDGKKYTDSRGAGFRRDDSGGRKPSTLRDSGSEKTRKYSDSRGAGYRRDDDRGDESNADDAADADTSDDDANADEPADDDANGADDDANGADDDANGADDDETPDVSMTRLENTKVMRLLENREFPVDKAEFVTVAASAYQISQQDCEKVLDLAIQHGLIHEEDGQLVGGDL